MKKYMIITGMLAAGALGLATASVVAQNEGSGPNHLTASLNGYQENPTLVTTGIGSLDLRIDDDAQTIAYELTYSDLEGGAATVAHIHLGSRAVVGGVSAFFCGGGGKPACPSPGGTVTGVVIASDVLGPAAQGLAAGSFGELVQAIRAGHTYVNVHTPTWPGGEIRGQIGNGSQQ